MSGNRKPPAAGKGRPKNALNKTTLAMKDAILSVYDDLQESAGGNNAHFKAWAEGNPTDFYKIASKLIPMDIRAAIEIPDEVDRKALDEWAQAEIDEIFGGSGIFIEHQPRP